ncbi:MAG: hypothetical protein JXR18_00410 [Neptuniibacter sp.]
MTDLIIMNEKEFVTQHLIKLMQLEADAIIEKIDCKGLSITIEQLESLLKPLRCMNGLVPEVTWLFDYLEDWRAEEEGLLSVVS